MTITRASDNSALNKGNAIKTGKNKIIIIEWRVPHYTSLIPQQAFLSMHFLSKTPTEPQYVEGSVFMKEVNTQNLWNFELRTQEVMNVRIWKNVGLQQKKRQNSQTFNNDTFYRLRVTSAPCIIGTKKILIVAFY